MADRVGHEEEEMAGGLGGFGDEAGDLSLYFAGGGQAVRVR